jgi:hypothetical protein
MYIAPFTVPGGNPVIEFPGLTPRSPFTIVAPVFVTVELARITKVLVDPRSTGAGPAARAVVASAVPDMLPDVAVITDVPIATPVARPLAFIIVATPVVPDDQITEAVISCDVPSENVPVAVN